MKFATQISPLLNYFIHFSHTQLGFTSASADLQNCKFCGIRMLQRLKTKQNYTTLHNYFKLNRIILNYTKLRKKSASKCADLNLRESASALQIQKCRLPQKSACRFFNWYRPCLPIGERNIVNLNPNSRLRYLKRNSLSV